MTDTGGLRRPHELQTTSIVGRDSELEELRALLSDAVHGQGRLVLVSGEAGIGKTTLINVIRGNADELHVLTLKGGCFDLSTTPPYGPWIDLASRRRTSAFSTAIVSTLTTGSSEFDSQTTLFDRVVTNIADAASVQPLMLVLEDIHWADPASLELLRFVARQLSALPVLIVASYRSDELSRRHPLYQVLPSMVREADAVRIDLRRLNDDELRHLLAGRYQLGLTDETRLVGQLMRQTNGNPFFLHETLRTLEDVVLERLQDGTWVLGDASQALVPPLIRQVVEQRLSRLSEPTRRALAVASVIGHEINLDLWQHTADLNDESLLAIVEEAVEASFLMVSSDNATITFVHALTREALYEGILPPLRRVWHRQAAEQLIESRAPDPDRVAHHLQQAGDRRAVEWLIQAADRAQRGYAYVLAADRLDAAERLMSADGEREAERGWLLYRIGRLVRFSDPERGIRYLEEASQVGQAAGDRLLAAYALADQGILRCMADDVRRGLIEMETGITAIEMHSAKMNSVEESSITAWVADAVPASDRRENRLTLPDPRVVTRRGTFVLWLAWTGRYREAIDIGEPFAELAATDPAAKDGYGDALHGLAIAYAATGKASQARTAFEGARNAYRSINHNVLFAVTNVDELLEIALIYELDQPDHILQAISGFEADWRSTSDTQPHELWAGVRTLPWRLITGDWQTADRIVRAASEHPSRETRSLAVPARAWLARHHGDADLSWRIIHQRLPDDPDSRLGASTFYTEIELVRIAIDLALDDYDCDLARRWIQTLDQWLAWSGDIRFLAYARLAEARLAHLEGDDPTARRLVDTAVGLANQPRQPLALQAALRERGRLELMAGAMTGAELTLRQALQLADACAAPFERAQSLLLLATLHEATGSYDVAESELAEVRKCCQQLGDTTLAAQIASIEVKLRARETSETTPAGLTARELEVLRLVAQGLTDAEVAEQMFIARRTVNTHLTSIYSKLNVNSRASATRFAVEHGLA